MKSTIFKLVKSDWVKIAINAAIGAIVSPLFLFMQSGGDVFLYNWKSALSVAATAALTSLIRRFLSNSDGKLLTPESK